MKKHILIVLITFFGQLAMQSQDIFQLFYDGVKAMPVITRVDSIITKEYNTISYIENSKPDTTIVINSDTIDLFLETRKVSKYPQRGTTVSEMYNEEDIHQYQEKVIQDEKGRMKEMTVVFSDSNVAQYMNST